MLSGLFERFTERARHVVVLAQDESRALRHSYIGSEHILLGLLLEEEGLAARVLVSLGMTVERCRELVVGIVASGDQPTMGQIPFTAHSKRVLELSLREALSLAHGYIGPEHLLLALARENDDVTARVLVALGVDAQIIRGETMRMLSQQPREHAIVTRRSARARPGVVSIDAAWLRGLGRFLEDLTGEIRRKLEREPDSGDLLLALGCSPDTLVSQVLGELGVDMDALPAAIERIRATALPTAEDRIEEVRQSKERAIESNQFDAADRLHDQERTLTAARRHSRAAELQEIRARLGIPGPDQRR